MIILICIWYIYQDAKEKQMIYNEKAENREQSRHTIKIQNNGKQK